MTIRLIGGPCDGNTYTLATACSNDLMPFKEIAIPVIIFDESCLRGYRAEAEVYQHVRGEVTAGQESQHEYQYVGRRRDYVKA